MTPTTSSPSDVDSAGQARRASDALVESWRLSLHDKTPATVKLYVRCMGYFTDWLAAGNRPVAAPCDLLAVERRDIERWLNEQRDAGLSTSTRWSRWVALRSFYNFLVDDDELDVSPVAKVKVERPRTPPPEVADADDLRLLLKACAGRDFEARRDLAVVRFMVATGLRLGEMAGLRLDDVDLSTRTASIIRGKGGKPRVVRFDAETAAVLDRYRRARARHRCVDEPWLWLGRKGRLSTAGIDAMLRRRGASAGITDLHPHKLRHSWAHLAKASGMSDEDVMRLGGWSDATVMHRYGQGRAVERSLAAYDVANPMADL